MTETERIRPCCLSGQIHVGTPAGHEETIGHLPCYVAEATNKSKAKSVIFLGDLFGYKLPNIRLLADEYAKTGLYVYVPDILMGDPVDQSFLQNAEPSLKEREKHNSLLNKSVRSSKVAMTMSPWLIRHRNSVTKPIIDDFIGAVKAIPGTSRLGVVGFCWGGKWGVLAGHGNNKLVGPDAIVICHPSMVNIPGDFEGVTKPLSLAIGDKDSLVNAKDLEKIRAVLGRKSAPPSEICVYEDQIHGFTLRDDWSSDKDKTAMDDAARQAVNWLHKYLSET